MFVSKVKIAVIYYSTYGTNHRMAEIAAEAARGAGAEVRFRKVRETAPQEAVAGQEAWSRHAKATAHIEIARLDDMEWGQGFIFSSPTRYGGACSQMRSFIDGLGPLWLAGKLADKTITAMTSAQNPHGGQETTLQTLYITFMHWGMILVPPGYTDQSMFDSGGNPYGVSVSVGGDGVTQAHEAAIRHQARRLVQFTQRLVRPMQE
jgi:NAD(P)H dehydrogenase (quinone)